jgi:hypothetical protein
MQTFNIVTAESITQENVDGSQYVIPPGFVVNTVLWDGATDWTPPEFQRTDENNAPIGNPVTTTAVPASDPIVDIGYIYDWATGLFTPKPAPSTQSPGLMSRILSALNPFK